MVNSTGSSSNLTDLMQQAVNAIGSYRTDLQAQLPAPISSLTQLKGVNNLDTSLTAQVSDSSPPLASHLVWMLWGGSGYNAELCG